jgi:hypothetical protein
MNVISNPDPSGRLEREAERIYRAIFGDPIPSVVRDRYLAAVPGVEQRADAPELKRCRHAVATVSDLEALELAGRILGKTPSLCLRFQLMVHIAETQPQNQHFFLNPTTNACKGWAALVTGTLMTAWKFLKGVILLKRGYNA